MRVLHPVAGQALVEAGLLLLDGLQAEGGADTGQILTIRLSKKKVWMKRKQCETLHWEILANKGNVKREISLIEKII